MTFWEHRTHPKRGRSLRILAAGFITLALGCAMALYRREFPGVLGSAAANLIILGGYLLILAGVASFSGRRYRWLPAGVLVGMGLVWAVGGTRWQEPIWNHVSSIPIALVSGLTAWEMLRCAPMKSLPSRYVVVAAAGIHTLVYTSRAVALPWLVTAYGPAMQALASKITIYEGVLYSVLLPMALLKLVREEAHSHLLKESQTDYLTRLGNRKWFFEEGARAIEGGARPLALLAFDLDHFKAINDAHGHHTGDRILASFAEIAQDIVGRRAVLARIGGEEFAALLTGDEARRARMLGEEIARRFAEAIPRQADSMGIPATVSIGLAQYEHEAPSLAAGLAAADRALYRAKALGGNRLEPA